jgi:hypothetical protein
MSTISTDFDWLAPVPQVFTRCDTRVFWPGDRRYRPHSLTRRTTRDLVFLTQGLPPELRPLIRQRFAPTRGPLVWAVPPALPTGFRSGYQESALRERSEEGICWQITLTAEMIERLLNAPEGMVTGLTHTYLLLIQRRRLRQLWEEVQRRDWPEDRLAVFNRALGAPTSAW